MNPSPSRFLQWLRWPNLLIVSFTLALVRYGLVAPALHNDGLFLSTDTLHFVILTLYALLVTFGGYIINDLYDQNTDALNKPDKQAIGIWISETRARALYLVVVLFGILIALYLDWHWGFWYWTGIYLLLVFLLWVYSRYLKASVLWGNVLVSLLCAAVVWIVPLAEMEPLAELADTRQLILTLSFYAAFAALSNLLREIIKDAEDREGDAKSGLNTLAVVYGQGASKKAALLAILLLAGAMLLFFFMDDRELSKLIGFSVLTLPFLLLILTGLLKKEKSVNWKNLSRLNKILMLGGLLGLLFLL